MGICGNLAGIIYGIFAETLFLWEWEQTWGQALSKGLKSKPKALSEGLKPKPFF